jgi:regulatory protein
MFDEVTNDVETRDEVDVARDTAIRLLARREHSTDELRRKLKRRGYGEATISEVVATLRDSQSVSDQRFAESFARVRSERGQGPLKIRADLRERGVTDVLVDEVLTTTSEFWLERANRARSKRFGDAPPATRDDWNRQARFLAQRGFPADLIYRALGETRS